MSIVTSKGAAEYRLTPDQLREIIAKDMGVGPGTLEVTYDIGTDYGPMDRGPCVPTLSGVRVKVLRPSGPSNFQGKD